MYTINVINWFRIPFLSVGESSIFFCLISRCIEKLTSCDQIIYRQFIVNPVSRNTYDIQCKPTNTSYHWNSALTLCFSLLFESKTSMYLAISLSLPVLYQTMTVISCQQLWKKTLIDNSINVNTACFTCTVIHNYAFYFIHLCCPISWCLFNLLSSA